MVDLTRLHVAWVGTLHPRTIAVYRGKRQSIAALGQRLPLKWRSHLGLRAAALRVYAPTYGLLRLVVTRNRHGNPEYLASNHLAADLTMVVRHKRSRWSVETIFRDTKQYGGLEAASAGPIRPRCVTWRWSCSPLSSCNCCAVTQLSQSGPSRSDGNWPSPKQAKLHRRGFAPVSLSSVPPRNSCL